MAKKTGLLFQIHDEEFGATYNQLINSARAVESDRRGIAYWADEEGGGRFTMTAAVAFAAFFVRVLDGEYPEVRRGFSSYDDRYKKWKDAQFSEGDDSSLWRLTGTLMNAVTIRTEYMRKKSFGVVHIDPTAYSQMHSYGGQSVSPPVQTSLLAKWLEHGTDNMPGRELFGASLRRFITLNFPEMTLAFGKAMVVWRDKNKKSYEKNKGGKRGTAGNIEDVSGSLASIRTAAELAGRNVEGDFGIVVKDLQNKGGGRSATEDKTIAKESMTMSKVEIDLLLASGMSLAEIKKWDKAAQGKG